MDRLEGKVALVTGAARGQGRSHAVRLAEEGADVIAVDIPSQVESVPYRLAGSTDLEETVASVESLGRGIVAAMADVRDVDGLRRAVADGLDAFGRLDVVVANAAVLSFGPLIEIEEEAFRNVIDVNLVGVWNTCRAAAPAIIDGGRGGSVVVIGSAAGLRGMPNIGHYVASKHGVGGLVKTLAIELGEHSIRVNIVHPGSVRTEMTGNEASMRLFLPDVDRPSEEEFAAAHQAMNLLPEPWAEPRDISDAVAFLASDEARFITGASIAVDIGMTTR